MLSSLSIRDVVLIDRLDLGFQDGLCVLTGETGAGKSILLDALGLALGERAEARLIRHGAGQAVVTAAFDLPERHPVGALLAEHGVGDGEDQLVLRRVLGADGRSKAFVNDQPVSIGLLKQIGGQLVEVHGQFESQRLLDASQHLGLLDAFGGDGSILDETSAAYWAWVQATRARAEIEAEVEAARRDEEFLRHAVEELDEIQPEPGEESTLAQQRALLMNGEQLLEAMDAAARELDGEHGAEAKLRSAAGHLERAASKAEGRLDEVIAAFDRTLNEAAEATALLEKAVAVLDLDPAVLERAEERLFALRALARKHDVAVDDLAALSDDLGAKLNALEDGGHRLQELRDEEAAARDRYVKAAGRLGKARRKSAKLLDKTVNAELEALKLGRAVFNTEITGKDESAWNDSGQDKVRFQAATNPGAPPGPLNKIASGGELARFTLAVKVVLAEADAVPTVVFDEVDAGVGGAVASAVGARLARLADTAQILVVTHSPQVAARGTHHWRVSKSDDDKAQAAAGGGLAVWTSVDQLGEAARKEEIARMLAGATVTDEARAAADSLLAGAAE